MPIKTRGKEKDPSEMTPEDMDAGTEIVDANGTANGTEDAGNGTVGTQPDATTATRKPRKPKGPALTWNADRDAALAETIASNPRAGVKQISASLKAHPAFTGDADLMGPQKVSQRIGYLRKEKGVQFPAMRGASRTGYVPDTDRLNSILSRVAG